MKFFTREWANCGMSNEATEAVVHAYCRHVEALDLPKAVKELAELNPHDGSILNAEYEDATNSLQIRIRLGDLQRGYFDAVLIFASATMNTADRETLSRVKLPAGFEILYDEVDREADTFVYRLLFYPTGEFSIHFSGVAVVCIPVADRQVE